MNHKSPFKRPSSLSSVLKRWARGVRTGRIMGYVVAGLIGVVVSSSMFSACGKVALNNPDSNDPNQLGIAPQPAPSTSASPPPVVGAAMVVGGGIQTGPHVKVISTIGEPLTPIGASVQTGNGVVVVPGVQGAYYNVK